MVLGRGRTCPARSLPPHRYGFYVEGRACPAPTELLLLFVVYRCIVRFQLYDAEMVGPLGLYGIAQGGLTSLTPRCCLSVMYSAGTAQSKITFVCVGPGTMRRSWMLASGVEAPRPHCCKNACAARPRGGRRSTTGSKWIVAISPSCHKQVPLNAVNDIVAVHDVVLSVHFHDGS